MDKVLIRNLIWIHQLRVIMIMDVYDITRFDTLNEANKADLLESLEWLINSSGDFETSMKAREIHEMTYKYIMI